MTDRKKKPGPTFGFRVGRKLDNALSLAAPVWAWKRTKHRLALEAARRIEAASYQGAERNRMHSGWNPGGKSADADLLTELPILRERSRDLVRNDPIAAGVVDSKTANVVGTGIRGQSRVESERLDLTDDAAGELQNQIEWAWKLWLPTADAAERLDFAELQDLVHRQMLENGEAIILRRFLPTDSIRRYSLAWDVVESDRLSTPSDFRCNGAVRDGVEIGANGQPVAYWIRRTHPGDVTLLNRMRLRSSTKSDGYERITARDADGRPNVLHLYRMKRAGQNRGVPWFAPVLNRFKALADYVEAEQVAAQVTACISLFVRKTDAYLAATNTYDEQDANGKRLEMLEPGIIEYLNSGDEIQPFIPQRPGTTFDPFVSAMLRWIAAGLGMSYELVAKDFSKTNYSSARAALLEAWRTFKCDQEWFARKFCQPAWDLLVEEAYLAGDIDVAEFYPHRREICRARWICAGRGWVDPLKEVQAELAAVAGGIRSLVAVAAEHGDDCEETIDETARIEAYKKKKGVLQPIATAPVNQYPPAQQPAEDTSDDEEDDDEK